jgi:hypothetical protein
VARSDDLNDIEHPRASPVSSWHGRDIDNIKQELHDALGEHGLPYWKALSGYLMGQVGRSELEFMAKGWLKGRKRRLLCVPLRNRSDSLVSSTA